MAMPGLKRVRSHRLVAVLVLLIVVVLLVRLLTLITNSDVSGYDVPEVSRWYSGSVCSGRGSEFVGDQPFFPPCRSDLPPGVATWGKFPYLAAKKFLKTSRNPCWKTKDGHVMCSPYFYLIGVSKSGTSDLYHRLTSHPDVVRVAKEPHFFDRRRYERVRSFQTYAKYTFKALASRVETDLHGQRYSHVIGGDASPSYFYDNYHWPLYSGNENCTEPRIILAHHLYHLNPHLKILMILRHPIHRLYSRYLFDHRNTSLTKQDPPSPRQFHSWVVDGLKKYRDCFQRWSLRHCVYNKTLMLATHELRIQESLYPVLLEDWLKVIPRDQFLFLRFEDYRHDMASQLRRVFDFLGLARLSKQEMKTLSRNSTIRNPTPTKAGPMLPETERLLQEFYQPFIRRFAAMLHDNKFLWEDLDRP